MTAESQAYHELTDLQFALMEVLWERGEATVAQVQEALLVDRGLAMTTVATVLSRLEKRQVVAHRTEGRQYVYRPLVSRDQVRDSMLSALTERLFQGDVTALLSHLLTAGEITPGDLTTVRRMIEQNSEETDV